MMGLGFCMTLLGTALLDLEILIQQPLINSAVPTRQAGYFIGALSGKLFCSGAVHYDRKIASQPMNSNSLLVFLLIAPDYWPNLASISKSRLINLVHSISLKSKGFILLRSDFTVDP